MRLQQCEVELDTVAPLQASSSPSAPLQQQLDVLGVVEQVAVVDDENVAAKPSSASKFFQTPGENPQGRENVGIEKQRNEKLVRDQDVIMPPGHDAEMELATDKVLSKGRILQELTKAVKLVSFYDELLLCTTILLLC